KAALDLAFFEIVEILNVFLSPERHGDGGSCFAARKEGASMHAGKPTDFAGDGADLGESASVGTTTVHQNVLAKYFLLQVIEDLRYGAAFFGFFRRIRFDGLILQVVDCAIAFELILIADVESLAKLSEDLLFDLFDERFVELFGDGFALRPAYGFTHLSLKSAEFLDFGMAEHQTLDADGFQDLHSPRLNHYDRLFRTHYNQIHSRTSQFGISRINYISSIDQTHAHSRYGIEKRYIRNVERGRGAGN